MHALRGEGMEEDLAAIEEDVERKRVAKNPFEQRFTTLVKTILGPFRLQAVTSVSFVDSERTCTTLAPKEAAGEYAPRGEARQPIRSNRENHHHVVITIRERDGKQQVC